MTAAEPPMTGATPDAVTVPCRDCQTPAGAPCGFFYGQRVVHTSRAADAFYSVQGGKS